MRKLSKFGKRVLGGSARRLGSVVNAVAEDLRGGLRELLDDAGNQTSQNTAAAQQPAKAAAARSIPKLGDPEKPAQLYGTQSCPWTGRALALLEREAASFEFIDLDAPGNETLRTWLVAETKQNTNPYVFLRGRFVGGFNALDEVVRLGQLNYEMMSPKERANQPSRVRIEIAERYDNNRSPPGES